MNTIEYNNKYIIAIDINLINQIYKFKNLLKIDTIYSINFQQIFKFIL